LLRNSLEIEERRFWKGQAGSYTINLPKKWADEAKDTDKGGSVFITRWGNRLIISSSKLEKMAPRSISLDIKKVKDSELKSRIEAAYMKDYDEIILSLHESDVPRVHKFFRDMKLQGLTPKMYKTSEIALTISTNPEKVSSILDDLYELYGDMFNINMGVLEEIGRGRPVQEYQKNLVDVAELDVDKISFLAKRMLHRALRYPELAQEVGVTELSEVIHYHTVELSLERINDLQKEVFYILYDLKDNERKAMDATKYKELFREAHEYTSAAYASRKKVDKLIDLRSRKDDILANMKKFGKPLENTAFEARSPALYDIIQKQYGLVGIASNICEAWINTIAP